MKQKILKKLNHKNIKYLGNLKFAEDYEKNFNELNNNLKTEFNKKKFGLHLAHISLKKYFVLKLTLSSKKYKNLLTIIIPRHTHRVDEIYSDLKKLGLKTILHSSNIKK